jgi:hypothetical protein
MVFIYKVKAQYTGQDSKERDKEQETATSADDDNDGHTGGERAGRLINVSQWNT